jgi:hypothetical protein
LRIDRGEFPHLKEVFVMRRTVSGIAALALMLVASTPARATIVFELGNNPQPSEENVLLNSGATGSTVTGTTNQSQLTVSFSSNQDTLTEPSNGQARVAASGTNALVHNVTISVPRGSFTDLIANPFQLNGAATITVNALGSNGQPETPQTFTLNPQSGGQSFFTVIASDGEKITSLEINSTAGFTDLRQVRISGAELSSVPEPSSLALLALGGLGLATFTGRRRPTAA